MARTLFSTMMTCLILLACHGQSPVQQADLRPNPGAPIGGPFENSEFFYVGMPKKPASTDTSAGWNLPAPKLKITGRILQPDGKTPAPGVILYYYQTNDKGRYADVPGLDRKVVRHGYIRGWVMSDDQGRYSIFTIRPAPYPEASDPAHIHPAILEPGFPNPYYIDEFLFDDDLLLTTAKRAALENRGGSGILRLVQQGEFWLGERDIILGKNIPNYPKR